MEEESNAKGSRSEHTTTNKGCLIDFNKLKVGDELYSIQHGELTVDLIGENIDMFPIICVGSNNKVQSFTFDGKGSKSHIGPVLFTENPFSYAIRQIRIHQHIALNTTKQNMELWKRITELEGK